MALDSKKFLQKTSFLTDKVVCSPFVDTVFFKLKIEHLTLFFEEGEVVEKSGHSSPAPNI